jgi:tetratricopeptide (TPR) repeat protein
MFALMYLGKCYYKTQNYTKAEEIFLKIKKYSIFPDDLAIRYWLGIIYRKTGYVGKAATKFKKFALKKKSRRLCQILFRKYAESLAGSFYKQFSGAKATRDKKILHTTRTALNLLQN